MFTEINIIDILTLLVSILGLGFIWNQLYQSSSSSKAALILQINRDLNTFSDISIKLNNTENADWVNKLSDLEKERILDYVSYFEGIYICYQRRLFSMGEINDYFAGRFFRLSNNIGIQKSIILNAESHGDIFRPIFKLHARLITYRNHMHLTPILPKSDLAVKSGSLYDIYISG